MHVDINRILKEQKRTPYWLSKQIDCNYQSLLKLINNETSSVSFSLLEDICIALNCSPTDVLIIGESTRQEDRHS